MSFANKVHPGPPADAVEPSSPSRRSFSRNGSVSGKRLSPEEARVAGPADRELLSMIGKAEMHTIKCLGEGAFGIVDLVLVQTVDQPLLCVRKKLLKQSEHNQNEPELEVAFLETCTDNPFIVQMWSHVVGVCDYTLLLEYCPYGALDKLLKVVSRVRSAATMTCLSHFSDKLTGKERFAGFTESEARFYIACCVLGLDSMHAMSILHRDLKPSNILIADNGYGKLGDLGLCKKLGPDNTAKSKVGTMGYMAPEVVREERKTAGYSYPADMWSLGIMIWEMVHGQPPRWALMSWYLTPTIHFPPGFSPALRSLLNGLLDKNPQTRMRLPELRSHSWFAGLDWDALEEQQLPAPSFPELERVHVHAWMAARQMMK